jgi:hypothetical protein
VLFGGAIGHALVTLELLQRVAFCLLRHVCCRDRRSELRDLLGLLAVPPSPSSRWIVATCSKNALLYRSSSVALVWGPISLLRRKTFMRTARSRATLSMRATRSTDSRISRFSFSYAARSEYGTASMVDRGPPGGTRTALLGDDTSRSSNACPNGISNFAGRVRS